MWQSFGIRVNNAHKKIENGKVKNLYVLSFSHKAVTKTTGTERKVLDKLIMNPKLITDYINRVVTKLGYKKVSEKIGAADAYYKKGKDCIYCIDAMATYGVGVVNIYIRCLEDTDENKAILVGGKTFM